MPNRSRRLVISISLLFGGAIAVMGAERGDASKSDPTANEAPDYDAIIESLVNRNPIPAIVDVGRGRRPLFPKDYDWEESYRVSRIRSELFRNEDPRLWECFLKHMDDNRYALTAGNSDPVDPRNYSVGDLCWNAAQARLEFAEVHEKTGNGERTDRLRLDLGNSNLRKWRKDRSEKSLYELQIEVCEIALEKIKAEKAVTPEQRIKIEQGLRDKIKLLSETTKPLFFGVSENEEHFNVFKAKQAEKIRDQYEREKKEKKEQEQKGKDKP